MLCAGTWGLLLMQEARGRWPSQTFSAFHGDGAGVGFGQAVSGEARLAAVARVGRMAPRPAPVGAAEHVQHVLWHLPGGGVWRCFGVYGPAKRRISLWRERAAWRP